MYAKLNCKCIKESSHLDFFVFLKPKYVPQAIPCSSHDNGVGFMTMIAVCHPQKRRHHTQCTTLNAPLTVFRLADWGDNKLMEGENSSTGGRKVGMIIFVTTKPPRSIIVRLKTQSPCGQTAHCTIPGINGYSSINIKRHCFPTRKS